MRNFILTAIAGTMLGFFGMSDSSDAARFRFNIGGPRWGVSYGYRGNYRPYYRNYYRPYNYGYYGYSRPYYGGYYNRHYYPSGSYVYYW